MDTAKEWLADSRIIEAMRFSNNRHRGSGIVDEVYHHRFGDFPVIFSAPHATVHIRDGVEKEQDGFTGALADILARLTGGTVIAMMGQQTSDPMCADTDHPFKQSILQAKTAGAKVVVDLHGMSAATAKKSDCDIGLGLGTIPTVVSGFMARAYRAGSRQLDLTTKCGLSAFAGLDAKSITMFALTHGLSAIQVEHAPDCRFGDNASMRQNTIRLHAAVTRAVVGNLLELERLHDAAMHVVISDP